MKLKLLLQIWLFILGFLSFGSLYNQSESSRFKIALIVSLTFLINLSIYFLYIKKEFFLVFKISCITINSIVSLVLICQLIAYIFILYKGAQSIITSTQIINLCFSLSIAILPSYIVYKSLILSKEQYRNENN